TILDLAGVPIPSQMQGRSLVPLLKGQTASLRDSFLIEHASDNVFPRVRNMGYQAVRTERWKYIRYTDLGMVELYDLQEDPYEMKNLIQESRSEKVVKEMQAHLDRLLQH